MTYTPCRYARQWPDLWTRLPDDRARQSLSDALANGRLEGVEPTESDVEDLVAAARGELSREEFLARTLAAAHREAAGHVTAG